jgi:hypothetical protein
MCTFIARLIIVVAVASTAMAAPRKIFEVTLIDVYRVSPLVCNVAIFGQPPPPATVDKIVRSTLESAILIDSSREILAMAFVGDRAMDEMGAPSLDLLKIISRRPAGGNSAAQRYTSRRCPTLTTKSKSSRSRI